MKTLKIGQLCDLSGLSRRQVAGCASRGQIPGVFREHGYQFTYLDTKKVRAWAARKMEARTKRLSPI